MTLSDPFDGVRLNLVDGCSRLVRLCIRLRRTGEIFVPTWSVLMRSRRFMLGVLEILLLLGLYELWVVVMYAATMKNISRGLGSMKSSIERLSELLT